ncbi:MAG: Ger(x)C family spore germination C-terminal domain-containing protein, partial [Clostridiales bacterium]|nr:Ger(x)C family spore germination C-terminal domain-containing protein [Clostridiales bacterium]
VSAIGIDAADGLYSVSAQIFIPKADDGGNQNKKIVTTDGRTVSEAVDLIKLKCGRGASMTQCYLVILGKGVAETDVLSPLDYFMRNTRVSWNAMLVSTSGSALGALENITNMEEQCAFSWRNFLDLSRRSSQGAAMTVKNFLSDMYSESRAGFLMALDPEKPAAEQNVGGSDAEEGGGSELQGSLDTSQKTFMFNHIQKTGELDRNGTQGLNWMYNNARSTVFSVDAPDDGIFGGAAVALSMRKKHVSLKSEFIGGVPHLTVRIKGQYDVLEIKTAEKLDNISASGEYKQSKRLAEAVNGRIEADLRSVFLKSQSLKTDCIGISTMFYERNFKEYKRYTSQNGKETFLDNVILRVECDTKIL